MIALAVVLALAAAVTWWVRRGDGEAERARGGAGGDRARRGDGARGDGARGDRPASAGAPRRMTGGDAGAAAGGPGAEGRAPELDYPLDSRPLTAADVQFLEPNRPADERRPLRGAGAPRGGTSGLEVLYTADRYAVTGDEELLVTLEVFEAGSDRRVPVEILSGELVTAPARGVEVRRVARLAHRDDGGGGDRSAGDRIYSAALHPRRAGLRATGPYVARVSFRAAGVEGEASQALHYTAARDVPARFTGRLGEPVAAGPLAVEAAAEVERPGTFIVDANLHAPGGRPLARAQKRAELDRGIQRVPLRFYGKILRDAGVSGPYLIRQLRGYRFAPGERPDRQVMPVWPGELSTGAHAASDFTGAPWSG